MKHIINLYFISSFFIIPAVYSADVSTKLPPSPTLSSSSHSSDDGKFEFPQIPDSVTRPQVKNISNFSPLVATKSIQPQVTNAKSTKKRLCTWCCSYFFGYKPNNKND